MNKINNFVAKKGATLALKVTLFVLGGIVLILSIFALPSIWKGGSAEFPEASLAFLLIVIGLYATTIPFFIALWQTLKLLNYIDQNHTFSDLSVRALKNIKYCATVIGVLYIGGVPLLLPIAEADDAPGLLLFGFAFACIPVVIAIFALVLERLLKSVIEMKGNK